MKRSERELPEELVRRALQHWNIRFQFCGCDFSSTEKFATLEEAVQDLDENSKKYYIGFLFRVQNFATGEFHFYEIGKGITF